MKLNTILPYVFRHFYPISIVIILCLMILMHFYKDRLQKDRLFEIEEEYTHVLPHNYSYSTELDGIRYLISRGLWNSACKELNRHDVETFSKQAQPVYLYLRGRIFRMLFEIDRHKIRTPDGRLSNTCAAYEFLKGAESNYKKVLTHFPDHFLADDALGWLGGCAYRAGNYLEAMGLYLELLKKYPRSDTTVKYVATDIKLCISKILELWPDIEKFQKEDFIAIIEKAQVFGENTILPHKRSLKVPETLWTTLSRRDLQHLLKILRMTNQIEGFLECSASLEQILCTIPLVKLLEPEPQILPVVDKEKDKRIDVSTYFPKLIDRLYYSGRFLETRQIFDSCWTYLPQETRCDFETFYWCSDLNWSGSRSALEVAMAKGFRNGVVAIAYDFLQIEELVELCENQPTTYGDILNVILADRIAESGDYKGAIERFFQVIRRYPNSPYRDAAYMRILNIIFYLEPTEDHLSLSSFFSILNPESAEYLELLRSFEISFFGSDFIADNRSLLNDTYERIMTLENMLWGWRKRLFSYKNVRSNFVTHAGEILLKIRQSKDFKKIPESNRKFILDLLELANSANSRIRYKFVYENNVFREAFVPYMRRCGIKTSEDFKVRVLPILSYFWTLMNVGKFDMSGGEAEDYSLFQKCDYLIETEKAFRTVSINEEGWQPKVYDLAYYAAKKEGLPLRLGSNYTQAASLLKNISVRNSSTRYVQMTYLKCVKCKELYALMAEHVHKTWLSVVLSVARANLVLSWDEDRLLKYRDISPIRQQIQEIKHEIPLLYAIFLNKWSNSQYSKNAAYEMANAYERVGNLELANRIRNEWDLKIDAEIQNTVIPSVSLGATPHPLVTDGSIIPLKASLYFIMGDPNKVCELTESLDPSMISPFHHNVLYLRGRSYLANHRPLQALECFESYIRQYPESYEMPFLVYDVLRSLTIGGETCQSQAKSLCELFDSLSTKATYFMNIYYFLYAKFQIALILKNHEDAYEAANRLLSEDYPTSNISQMFNLATSHPLIAGTDLGDSYSKPTTILPQRYFFFWDGSLHSFSTQPANTEAE